MKVRSSLVDQPEPDGSAPRRGASSVSRLPWRYSAPGRRQLVTAATVRLRVATGGRPGSGYDVDDHIRLAVREESAANLGRAGGKLKDAVATLAAFATADDHRDPDVRTSLLDDAALALWEYVVQREAMGLTNHDIVNQVYGVTPELWRRVGSERS